MKKQGLKYTTLLVEKSLAEDIKKKYRPEYWRVANDSVLAEPTAQDFWYTYLVDLADAGQFGEQYEDGKKQLTEKQLFDLTSAIMEDDQLWNEIDNEVLNIAPNILEEYKKHPENFYSSASSKSENLEYVPMFLEVSLANDIKKYHKDEYYKETTVHPEFTELPKTVNFHPEVTAKEFWTQYFKDIADAGMLGEEYEEGEKELPDPAIEEMIAAIMESDRLWDVIDSEVQDIAKDYLSKKQKKSKN